MKLVAYEMCLPFGTVTLYCAEGVQSEGTVIHSVQSTTVRLTFVTNQRLSAEQTVSHIFISCRFNVTPTSSERNIKVRTH